MAMFAVQLTAQMPARKKPAKDYYFSNLHLTRNDNILFNDLKNQYFNLIDVCKRARKRG